MGLGSEIRDLEKTFSGSRIPGSKRHRIPDPDPQHCLFYTCISLISRGDKPVVTAKDAKGLKYKMSEEFTVEAFETFVTALKAGELEPFLKSGMCNIVLGSVSDPLSLSVADP
jgi:hypothetical protein